MTTHEADFWKALDRGPDPEAARRAFADWLAARDDPRARYLRDPDLAQYMRPGRADPSEPLLEALRADEYHTWQPAAELLGRVGTPAVPALLALVREGSYEIAARACVALGAMAAAALRPVLPDLIALIPDHGRDLAEAFRALGPDAAPAVPALLQAAEKRRLDGRTLAYAVEKIGPAAAPALERLVTVLCTDRTAAANAARALVAIGHDTLDAVLAGFARHPDALATGARHLMVYGLEAIPDLVRAARERTDAGREAAILGLVELYPEEATAFVVEYLQKAGKQVGPTERLFVAAVRSLGPRARDAVPALRAMLGSPGGGAPDEVALALAAIAPEEARTALAGLLTHKDAKQRLQAVRALAAVGDPAGLLPALKDADAGVRAGAASALAGLLRRDDTDAVAPLRAALKDADARVRGYAAAALGRVKAAAATAAPDLVAALGDKEAKVRAAAARALASGEHESAEVLAALVAALDDADEEVREAAASALGNATRLFDSFAAVFARLDDADPAVRRGAGLLVARATEATPEVVAFLRRTLTEGADGELRQAAAAGLGRLKVATPETLAALFAFLDGEGGGIEALCRLGPTALAGLGERLLERPELRYGILSALNRCRLDGDGECDMVPALPGLLACLSDPEANVREYAAHAIGRMGKAAAAALPALRLALQDESFFVRARAVRSLGQVAVAPAEVLPDVLPLLEDPEDFARTWAVAVLAELEVEPAQKLAHLRAACRDASKDARKEAVEGLSKLGPAAAGALPELIAALGDADEFVRTYAAVALGNIGSGAAAAATALRAALNDPEAHVRRNVEEALAKVEGKP